MTRTAIASLFVLAICSQLTEAGTNVALGKKVTLGNGFSVQGNGALLVDGQNAESSSNAPTWYLVDADCSFSVYAEIDLGAQYDISEVHVWQLLDNGSSAAYCGQRLELSTTGLFIGEQSTPWNTGPSYGSVETSSGKLVAQNPGTFRFVRYYTSKSNLDNYARISEISVIGTLASPKNLAKGKAVTLSYGSSASAVAGALVDGDSTPSAWTGAPNWNVNDCSQTAYATIDLGQVVSISEVRVWQYYGDARSYCNQKLELSLNGYFGGEQVTTYNTGPSFSSYIESSTGNVVASNPAGVFRYVRYYSSKSNRNNGVHMAEISVLGFPAPLPNLAAGKPVTLSSPSTNGASYNPASVTDGITEPSVWVTSATWDVPDCSQSRYVTIDLGAPASIEAVRVWQYHGDIRKYCGQKLEFSLTGAFNGEQTPTWNTGTATAGFETQQGTIMTSSPVGPFRFVRFSSSKSTRNNGIHILEIAVYGVPARVPNIALGKSVTLSHTYGSASGIAANLVDGDSDPAHWPSQPNWGVDTCAQKESATIDLGALYEIQQVKVWQYYGEYPNGRFYCGQLLELSQTGAFNGEQRATWNTGSAYTDISQTPEGNKLIPPGSSGVYRYVRYSSSRSTANAGVHIAEVAVYGFPPVAVATSSVSAYNFASASVVAVVAAMCVGLVVAIAGVAILRRRRPNTPLQSLDSKAEPEA